VRRLTWQISLPTNRRWAKSVSNIDTRLSGGYAIFGDWISKKTAELKMNAWWDLVVLEIDGVLEAYLASHSGVFRKRYIWNEKKKVVLEELKRVIELKTYIFNVMLVGYPRELGPVPEWLAFPSF
jgi:hypothetical protein